MWPGDGASDRVSGPNESGRPHCPLGASVNTWRLDRPQQLSDECLNVIGNDPIEGTGFVLHVTVERPIGDVDHLSDRTRARLWASVTADFRGI